MDLEQLRKKRARHTTMLQTLRAQLISIKNEISYQKTQIYMVDEEIFKKKLKIGQKK